jgi:hypothetical protein
MNISTAIKLQFQVLETVTAGLAVAQGLTFEKLSTTSFSAGTGADQADLHWEKKAVTLAAGASVTYTLSALADDLGRAVALVGVRALLIEITARTAGDYLTVGNAGTNPWAAPFGGGTQTAKVFKRLLLVADKTDKYAVAAGSSDQLKITNSGAASVTFDVAAVGVSA